jgi:hypothetical protein
MKQKKQIYFLRREKNSTEEIIIKLNRYEE